MFVNMGDIVPVTTSAMARAIAWTLCVGVHGSTTGRRGHTIAMGGGSEKDAKLAQNGRSWAKSSLL
jgi:hypothetical protein